MQLNFPFMSDNTNTKQTDNANLSLGDIQSVVNLIDIVSSRGAFKGPELTSVGNLRDTFERFLRVHTPAAAPQDSQVAETTAQA